MQIFFTLSRIPLDLFTLHPHPPSSASSTSRLLEQQLQAQRRTYDTEVESLRSELQSVKEDNNRQQQLLAQNLQLPPEARIEASLQHEITRLTNENLVRLNQHPVGHAGDQCRRHFHSLYFFPL